MNSRALGLWGLLSCHIDFVAMDKLDGELPSLGQLLPRGFGFVIGLGPVHNALLIFGVFKVKACHWCHGTGNHFSVINGFSSTVASQPEEFNALSIHA